jgi:Fe-S cluster assembly protein SufD
MPNDAARPLPFAERYGEVAPALAGAGAGWLDALRRDGLRRYSELGLPGPKVEAWKYTNLTRLGRGGFAPALLANQVSLDGPPTAGTLAIDAPRLVLVNGAFRSDLSDLDDLPDGVEVTDLADGLARAPDALEVDLGVMSLDDMPMLALNTALIHDGLCVRIASGREIETPIHIVSVGAAPAEALAFHPRTLVRLGEGARATLVESHIGLTGGYLSNGATSIEIGAGAALVHAKLQNDSAEAYHLAATIARIGEGAAYENFTLQVGGRLARNEIHATLLGTEIDCRLIGAYAGRGRQHIDNTTFIDHARPNCTSREVYKGALDDQARGVFQGKILVRKDAQKTDGHQLNKALLLSPGAEIDSKPELEIYADDVKCSHGATTGEIDGDQLFYLRQRGVDEATARDLLVAAFLNEGLEEIADEDLRSAFGAVLEDWLSKRRVEGPA